MMTMTRLLRENTGFLAVLLLIFASRSSIADWYEVPSGSMQPTIVEGDRILVDKMAYRLDIPFTNVSLAHFADPQRGDIVVFESEAADERLVKRVIGVAGDTLSMRNNRLWLNGEPLQYDAIESKTQYVEALPDAPHRILLQPPASQLQSFGTVTVPEGHVLVLGDNRNNSADSRVYGFVPLVEIQGRAHRVLISFDTEHFLSPRQERIWKELI
ncbi:signal peptidase I [Aestuariibacter halophilus]|uniref:Signal peptidase I n=1 Tax=Fluctibacter halophilus TaxID=226011 RepID=A0ABS8G6X5_9ALTE|nr:signal peptidase I [Aestuariibacter halophilus]MCC2616300.1 signal peptidase I [Aestuariibacter halophilus]